MGVLKEAVDVVGAVKSVAVGNNVQNIVVLTFLVLATLVLDGLVLALTLAEGSPTGAIETGDGGVDIGSIVVPGLRVVVAEDGGLLHVHAGEKVAIGVLREGLERGVRVLGLASIPLGHGAGDRGVGDEGVRRGDLVHSEETVDVGVVEPEKGVERRVVQVVHVTASLAASGVVDRIVNRLEAINNVKSIAGTDLGGRD